MLLLVFSYRNDLANLLFGSSSKVWGAKDCQLGGQQREIALLSPK